ncbi:MAG: discoidin domain-containing protein [Armatimonadetes bacterium]|nr:discoidin domain-containing protein [Armatimonadota bacterium]
MATLRRAGFGMVCLALATATLAQPLAPDQPNAFAFAPREARFVRVLLGETSNGQPCLDEIEVLSPAGANLAREGQATASSALIGYAIHQIANLNDGQYGNEHSWIAAGNEGEWAQIELARPAPVAKVVVSRDRGGKFRDRWPDALEIRLSLDGQTWTTVAKVGNLSTLGAKPTWDELLAYAFAAEQSTWSRVSTTDHLSPLVTDRPAEPGGEPYWSKLAHLGPADRLLTQFGDMAERLAAKGVDVSAERAQLARLRTSRAAAEADTWWREARLAKRQLMLRDPDLAALTSILFVKRHPYLSSHNYSDVLDSQFKSGGGVCRLDLPRRDGRLDPAAATLTTLFDGTKGIARDAVIDGLGRRVIFAFRPSEVPGDTSPYWHLMSTTLDGSDLKQLTDGPFHDYYPCPLPDGGLAFITTRCRARFLCWRPQAFVLFRMDADGGNVQPLSHANLSEWTPATMRDGRILWTRSEYVDKGADFGHTLWAIHPDGTHPELIYGNDTPNCYMGARQVPGSRELLCTLVSHGGDHNGPLALIDTAKGPFDTAAITNITPDVTPQYNMTWIRRECFRDPVPVTRDYYVASHAPADRWGLYLVDRWGNRELLYLDPAIGSMEPTLPAEPTPAPVLAPAPKDRAGEPGYGSFTVADVYQGLTPAVPRGRIKWLRVCQEVRADLDKLPNGEFAKDSGDAFQDVYATPIHRVNGPYGWPSYVAKSSLGLVPVEADGSASFNAPADKVLYFEVLDENLNEIQRMRSVVQLQPGERRGCIGCHEDRQTAPPSRRTIAANRPPSSIEPPPWGAVPFSYERVVQPVLNANCVRCHQPGGSAKPSLTATLDPERVPESYRSLIAGGFVHYFDMTYGLRHHKAQPLSFGTLASRLLPVLDGDHHGVKLSLDERHAIKCWIDLNCPLWPDYVRRENRPAVAAR